MGYDSQKDTFEHIVKVRNYISKVMYELSIRSLKHDHDKIDNPTEKALFDEYTPKLKECTYGSEEYKKFLAGLKEGLDIHYSNNRHHPEHFENGISGMNLIDLIEMICDWIAASERHSDGDIFRSIEINQKRFGYSDDLKCILENTVTFIKKVY
ncbi:MAG: hypothetical protein J6O99_06605 [Methanobrevibacter sp.]|nr:hypothetical protein [Methanobrevibacter sp.]